MDFAAKPIWEGRERYWMNELQTIFPYDLYSRVGGEFKIDNMRINVAAKFSSILSKNSPADGGKNENKTVKL